MKMKSLKTTSLLEANTMKTTTRRERARRRLEFATRAPSDPFVANGTEDATSSAKSLRAKPPAGQPKKSPMEGHAASYKPIGPSSPKRLGQAAMGPPSAVPTTNSTGPALL
ncbi:unnamed protein product [Aureobasidium mustum]|uniref:Uncharacterized protein n=1 Tax=Aureobasidium mustum TaxID=2773714 RepID=A0A9N8PGC4_9PEZI|nr:unnamed protein product [Aureobasidium mustum]